MKGNLQHVGRVPKGKGGSICSKEKQERRDVVVCDMYSTQSYEGLTRIGRVPKDIMDIIVKMRSSKANWMPLHLLQPAYLILLFQHQMSNTQLSLEPMLWGKQLLIHTQILTTGVSSIHTKHNHILPSRILCNLWYTFS